MSLDMNTTPPTTPIITPTTPIIAPTTPPIITPTTPPIIAPTTPPIIAPTTPPIIADELHASFTSSATSGTLPLKVYFYGGSTGGTPTSWTWDFGDGATSTEQNPAHIYTETGNFQVKLKVSNGAESSEYNNYIPITEEPKVPEKTNKPITVDDWIFIGIAGTLIGGLLLRR